MKFKVYKQKQYFFNKNFVIFRQKPLASLPYSGATHFEDKDCPRAFYAGNGRKRNLACFLFFAFVILFLNPFKAASQTLPPFQMKESNGKIFTSKDLSLQKPTVIIYFSPDCEHCITLMNGLFKKISSFKKAQIVMVTFNPMNEVIGFEKAYKTANYSNIKVGVEIPVFFFRNYYKLDQTPFTALYDKHKKLIISYKNQTPLDDLIKHLKVL